MKKLILLILTISIGLPHTWAQKNLPKDLDAAMDQYLSATVSTEATSFNLMMQYLSKNCIRKEVMSLVIAALTQNEQNDKMALTILRDNYNINNYGDLYDLQCVSKQILSYKNVDKFSKLMNKIVSPPAESKMTKCLSNATCPGKTSCLPISQEDYPSVLLGKGNFLEALINTNEENDLDNSIASKELDSACEFNYQCKSLSCNKSQTATDGKCVQSNICRLGRTLEKIKEAGACEEGLTTSTSLTCLGKFSTDETLLKSYIYVKDDLAKRTCGDFSNQEVGNIREGFAYDLRAFELMMLSAQDLSKDLAKYKGAEKQRYHKIPKRINELFLTNYLEEKKSIILNMNKEFAEFNKNFENVITSDGKSLSTVNFYDIQLIQKEMNSSKETAVFYLNLYKHWIKTQQKFHRDTAKSMYENTVDNKSEASGLMAVLNALARTTYKSKTAPLFNDKGPKNSKRWFLSLELPHKQTDYKFFEESPYIKDNAQELQYSNFSVRIPTITNDNSFSPAHWYWGFSPDPSMAAMLNALMESVAPQLLDPILPPAGCNIIDQTKNECGSEKTGFWGGDWYSGTNGKFNQDIPKTLENLHDSWYNTVVKYYKKLAEGLPANYIIDPELNIYAGCIQQSNLSVPSSSPKTPPSSTPIAEVSDFYKNFCAPDLNKNGIIDADEKLVEKSILTISKKIMAYSLAYSYNRNKRPSFAAVSNSYTDEFIKDESASLQKNAAWIDLDIKDVDLSSTKFFNFQHGVKKRFLNRIRNKYFFMTQLYYLLGNNYDKQLKCIDGSFGDFNQSTVLDNAASPTATPAFNSGSNNNKSATPVATSAFGTPAPSTLDNKNKNKTSSSLSLSSGQTNSSLGNESSNYSNKSAINPELLTSTSKEKAEEKKGLVLGGVSEGGQATSGTAGVGDRKANADYNFLGADETNSKSGEGFNAQEKEKINAALNSNQEPQFGQEDSIFNQITIRYVKNYKSIFRTERRGSAQ